MKIDFETLYFDAAKKKVIETTRNKPNIACYNKKVCNEYAKTFHGKTRNRKEMKPIVSFGKTFIYLTKRKNYFSVFPSLAIAPLEKFKDIDDPVETLKSLDDNAKSLEAILRLHSEIPNSKIYKTGGENYIVGPPDGAKIVTKKKVPDNAVIISIDPPIWMQIGQNRLLFTRGALWLDEKIEEFDLGYVTVEKKSNHYVVKLNVPKTKVPMILIDNFPYGILQVYPGKTPLGARALLNEGDYGEEKKAIVSNIYLYGPVYYKRKAIFLKDGKLIEQHFQSHKRKELPLELVAAFKQIEDDGTVYYVPEYYVR